MPDALSFFFAHEKETFVVLFTKVRRARNYNNETCSIYTQLIIFLHKIGSDVFVIQ